MSEGQPGAAHLQDVDEHILLWLPGAAHVLQHDGVIHTLHVRLVQIVGVRLIPFLDGQEHLVLVRADNLDILGWEESGGDNVSYTSLLLRCGSAA